MYDKLLRFLESTLKNASVNMDEMDKLLDNIIKIKTIQALDTSAELIAASRRVSRN